MQCWGDNSDGELGDGRTTAGSTTPGAVKGLTGVTAISVGPNFACALGGTLQCWGSNEYGELGIGTTTGPDTCPNGEPCSATPVAVTAITSATSISVGWTSACALLSGGTVQCWGSDASGELGIGTTTARSATPIPVTGITDATAISVGDDSACAVLSEGTVQCWGGWPSGQLFSDAGTNSLTPVAVTGLAGATAVSAGMYFACALLSGGTVQCWGSNDYGLGNGTTTGSATPVTVQ